VPSPPGLNIDGNNLYSNDLSRNGRRVTIYLSDDDDDAANITAAVHKTGLTHLFCFTHTVNLVVQNGVRVVKDIQDKVKAIVEHFRRSSVACEKLLALQRQMRPDHSAVKLKNDVVTRWNSTYDMLRRISKIQEPVEAAIAVLGKPVDILTTDEWLLVREAVTTLCPFKMVKSAVR